MVAKWLDEKLKPLSTNEYTVGDIFSFADDLQEMEISDHDIIPPAEHSFEHNTLVSWVTPESTIHYFSSIIRQTLFPEANNIHVG